MHILDAMQPRIGEYLTKRDVENLKDGLCIPLGRVRLICALGYLADDLEFMIVTHHVPTVVTVGALLQATQHLLGMGGDRYLIHNTRTEKDLNIGDRLHMNGT
jgi:hypothetical protein